MKRVSVVFLILLVMPVPMSSIRYEPVSYSDDGVRVFVTVEANTPWTAPFNEKVNVTISVEPLIDQMTQVNITRIDVILNKVEADQSDYILMAADEVSGTPITTGVTFANFTSEFNFASTDSGTECYFAVMVSGAYRNATHIAFFQALSPENLVGPFVVTPSIESPIVWVGLIVMAIAGVIFAAGIYGVKKSRKRSTRKRLSD